MYETRFRVLDGILMNGRFELYFLPSSSKSQFERVDIFLIGLNPLKWNVFGVIVS